MSARAIAATANPHGDYPIYTRAERFVDAVVHALGVVGSVVAFIVLIAMAAPEADGATLACLIVYGLGMTMVFSFSAAYHLIALPSWKGVLRRLDHAAIFVKIAGTYTPFALISIGGAWGAALMGSVWSIAAIGVPLKLWAPTRFERSSVWLYLAQGWLVLFAIGPLASALSTDALIMLVSGGVLYTIGVGFHLADKLPFHNAIWHIFVLAASGCMYGAVMSGVALSTAVAEPALAPGLFEPLP